MTKISFLLPIRLLSIVIFSFFIWWLIGVEGFVLAVDCDNAINAEGGSHILSSSCIVPAGKTMIVVNGGLTINEGVTLTLDSNSRLLFGHKYQEPGEMEIIVNGNISLASGSYISEIEYSIHNNYSGGSCAYVCWNNYPALHPICVGIGQDSYATDGYYWRSTSCSGGSCEYVSGDCSTSMITQCDPPNTCCGIGTYWTRCLCVKEWTDPFAPD